jgi:hypothetical protein
LLYCHKVFMGADGFRWPSESIMSSTVTFALEGGLMIELN